MPRGCRIKTDAAADMIPANADRFKDFCIGHVLKFAILLEANDEADENGLIQLEPVLTQEWIEQPSRPSEQCGPCFVSIKCRSEARRVGNECVRKCRSRW